MIYCSKNQDVDPKGATKMLAQTVVAISKLAQTTGVIVGVQVQVSNNLCLCHLLNID